MLKRRIENEFLAWKNAEKRKGLFVVGPRQVGKSYAIRAFGQAHYARFIEINLYDDKPVQEALLQARNADDFIARVTMLSNKSIVEGDTLVFIDEVQEAPDIMTAAKFLVADGRCDWAFSGSMPGTEFRGVRSHPVGSVHELAMHPLDFEEFCWAIEISDEAFTLIRECCLARKPVVDYVHDAMLANWRTYLVVGGMPEAVCAFIDTKGDLAAVRTLQQDLNKQYRRDISKYAGARALHVQAIYDQLPVQLEGDSQRFLLNSLDPKARFEKYRRDFAWLENAGVALRTALVSKPKSPLARTKAAGKFKLYQSDTGMLMARYPLPLAQAAYLDGKHQNLGAVYENAVAQELTAQGHELYYCQTKKRGEVDFIIDADDGDAVCVEVKSGRYYHAHAALDHVLEAPGYGARRGIVLSRGNVEQAGKTLYLPCYASFVLPEFLRSKLPEGFRLETRKV